jgi:opacity protein-like surface antigen
MATRPKPVLVMLVLAVVASVVGLGPAQAEWAADLYGGVAWVQSFNLDVSGRDDAGSSVNGTLFDVDSDPGFTVGARGGYWFDSLPFLGLGLDLFLFVVPVPNQTVQASASFTGQFLGGRIVSAEGQARLPSESLPGLGFSPELRLRWPLLTSPEFPTGRLQPYFTGGPAWGFTVKNSDISLVTGGKIGVGTSYSVLPFLALFAEYRFLFFPNFEVVDRHLTYKADINNHNLIFGISFRF